MKTMLFALLAAGLAVPVLLAGNTCTWTGGAGDGKWSSAANWDTPPVSGNDDALIFAGGNVTSENVEIIGPYAKFAELRQTGTSIEVSLNRGTMVFFR